MTQAIRQSIVLPADEWVSIDEAAKLTGESIRNLQRRASWELRSAGQAGRQTLARKAPPASGTGKPVWYVHRSFDPKLSRCVDRSTREDQSRSALADRFPQHKVEQAYQKAHWLRKWRSLCDQRRIGNVTEIQLAERIVREAKQTEGPNFPISMRSLQLWHGAYYATGADGQIRGVEGLIDRRGVEDQGDGKSTDARDPQAVEYFYEQFHCQSRLTVKTCHEITIRRAKQNGWSWPASYSAVRNWLQTYDDLSLTCLLREGRDAWQHRYMPHIEMDYTQIEPGDLFVCDHAQCDFWIEHQGKQLRPWLAAIQDARSRCIVGWHLGIAPHQDSIVAALRMAFKDWAIPKVMRIDNGRDWTSKLLTGITKHTRNRLRREYGADWRNTIQHADSLIDCGVDSRFKGIIEELAIELIYAIPYAPWSKMIERFFGTFHDQCGKTFATYCGNSTLHRPECLEVIRRGYTKAQKRSYRKRYGREWKKVATLRFVDQSDVPSLETARNAIGEWIEVYHRTGHQGQGMEGATPLAMWQTASTLRRADWNDLLFLMQSRGVYKVGRNGVKFKVGNATLGYGACEPKLYSLRGREVFITIDPADLSHCFAWTPQRGNRRFIARLESNKRISPLATVDELREANASVQRRRKVGRQADREAPARTRSVAQELTAQRRERLAELRATGTEGGNHRPTITPVRTGFEGESKSVQPHRPPPRSRSDIATAMKALTFGHNATTEDREPQSQKPRATLEMLAGIRPKDGQEQGTDAEQPRLDPFGLIAGKRHERTSK